MRNSAPSDEAPEGPAAEAAARERLADQDLRVELLVVGGGPAGTAAAFRARELGIDALVVDYDDILKNLLSASKKKTEGSDSGNQMVK